MEYHAKSAMQIFDTAYNLEEGNTDPWRPCPADKLSPFKFYQYLLTSTPDADVIRFLKMLTFLPLDRIDQLQHDMAAPEYKPNTAQRLLAEEVTRFVHGEEGLQQALNATQVIPTLVPSLTCDMLNGVPWQARLCSMSVCIQHASRNHLHILCRIMKMR